MQTVVPNILGLEAIILALSMARRNVIVNQKQNSYFIKSAIFLGVFIFCETMSVLLDGHQSKLAIVLNNLVNIVCFAIPPIMIMMLLFMRNARNTGMLQMLAVLCGLNILISLSSPFTHILFYIDEDGFYQRGFLNPLTMLLTFVILVRLIFSSYKYFTNADSSEKIFLIGIFFVGFSGALLQLVFEGVLCMALGMAMSYLLYYTFNMELVMRYDSVTNLKNRGSFNKGMELMEEKNRVCIFMADMNFLKRMNDTYGHHMGDKALAVVAELLMDSIGHHGTVYRIGGDEFCALCPDISETDILGCIRTLEELEIKRNRSWNNEYKISIAYGYAFYERSSGKTVHEAFMNADKNMYIRKKEMKQKEHPYERAEDGR